MGEQGVRVLSLNEHDSKAKFSFSALHVVQSLVLLCLRGYQGYELLSTSCPRHYVFRPCAHVPLLSPSRVLTQ